MEGTTGAAGGEPGGQPALIVPRRERQDITDRIERADRIEPRLAADPIENADAAEPIDPIDNTEPTEPIERIDPFDPMLRIEFSERIDHSELWASVMVHIVPHPATRRTPDRQWPAPGARRPAAYR